MDALADAEQRLERAKAAVDAAFQRGDWHAGKQAHAQQFDAERHLARLRGEQYAEPLDLGLRWDTGAPLPRMLADSWRTIVIFHRPEPDPDWDGTYVRIMDAGQATPAAIGLVEFTGVHLTAFGGLNDEAIQGHPLSGRGLAPYEAHLVRNSSWIAEAERANSIHPRHRGGWHQEYNHYVLCFHDETFECIARSHRTEALHCTAAVRAAIRSRDRRDRRDAPACKRSTGVRCDCRRSRREAPRGPP